MTARVVYKRAQPLLSIRAIRSISPFRCVTETDYEVISDRGLTPRSFELLDELGAIGVGQCYRVIEEGAVEDVSPGVVTDARGNVLDEPVPEGTKPYVYTNHRYVVRRTCDSGD